MTISIKKGLDIPLAGKPTRFLGFLPRPRFIALNLQDFEHVRFKVLVRVGDTVKIGQALAQNKNSGIFFASPASGIVKEIRRGLKRSLSSIVIECETTDHFEEHGGLSLDSASREDIIAYLVKGGVFPHIRMRPFDVLANPADLPRDIFVHAIESLPFVPSAELQVEGFEEDFQIGLDTLSRLTSGKVHLIYPQSTICRAFTAAKNVVLHPARGPHPIGNVSVHIQAISPIKSANDVVWTLSTTDCIAIGKMIRRGRYHHERVIATAGTGLPEKAQGYAGGRAGYPISLLIAQRQSDPLCIISGDPLIGRKVSEEDFVGFYDTVVCAIPENTTQESFHFLRLGAEKYSATRAYLTGHFKKFLRPFAMTTNQHGEERAFIDGSIYDRFMPLRIPTMLLVKAVMAEDFEWAERLGILEVAAEDFALPTFICPSKVEMVEIMKQGLYRMAKDLGH